MDFFDSANEMEKFLRQKCADTYTPFSGGLELTPECNMDCKFCYVHQNRNNRKETGELLSAEQWCGIIDQAFDMGVYSLLITGGEPLMHPEFRKIFAYAAGKGMPVVLNSNGTLMDEDCIDFLKRNGCRRINLSLYGADNETYEKLCGLRNGFDKVMRTLRLLKEKGMTVRISVSLVPQNIDQIDEINQITKELDFPVQFTSYMFPGTRRGISAENQYRLTPEEAASASIKCFHLKNPNVNYEASCRFSLSKLVNPDKYNHAKPGFLCYAGKSDFWLSWNGEMRPCGTFRDPALSYNLLEHSFAECWEKMTADCRVCNCVNSECRRCAKRDLCQVCPASSYAETGRMDGKPEYLCKLTDGLIRICRQAVEDSHSTEPLVSIIVPVYNAEKYLKDCVESILQQNLQAFELILVNDGSTDQSGAICDQFAANDSRIRIIHQPNQGVSAARNAGIRAAKAKYILFIDSDDYVETDFVRELYHKAIDLAKENTASSEETGINRNFIQTNTWVGDDDYPRKLTIHSDFEDTDHISLEEFRHNTLFAYVWNKIYDRDLILKENIFFDESLNYNEDNTFNLVYIKHCTNAASIPSPLYVHLIHKDGLAMQGLAKNGESLDDVRIEGRIEMVKR